MKNLEEGSKFVIVNPDKTYFCTVDTIKTIPSKLPGTPLPIFHERLAGLSTDKIAELLSLQIDIL